MWPVPRPTVDARTVYWTCIGNARPDRRRRLIALETDVVAAADRYAVAAAMAALHSLAAPLQDQPDDAVDRDELITTYKTRMVGAAAPGRDYYDLLLQEAPHGICPLCGEKQATTLDHQLPKSSYPLLSVVPDNLVPACSYCNQMKNRAVASDSAGQTLHPYFDDANHARWLYARVRPHGKPLVEFYAQPAAEFTPVMQARIVNHFTQFRLASVYSSQAARELAGMDRRMAGLRLTAGSEVLIEDLREQAASWAGHSLNCWQSALFEALAESPDYVHGGLAAIM